MYKLVTFFSLPWFRDASSEPSIDKSVTDGGTDGQTDGLMFRNEERKDVQSSAGGVCEGP